MTETSASSSTESLRVLQISDCHLFGSDEGALIGVNTENSLQAVLDLVREKELKDGAANFDCILATGDLSQDGSEVSYQRLKGYLDSFKRPVYSLPGNHDNIAVMKTVYLPESLSPSVVTQKGWSFITLNSPIPGEVPGRLEADQLKFLGEALEATKKTHVAVCLHHHPLPLSSAWLDGVGLLNPEPFLEILDRYTHVKAVIYGHVHQDNEQVRNGVRYFALPSTCIQFKPECDDFTVDTVSPGYRTFEFFSDGQIQTEVLRADKFTAKIDTSVTGY